MELVPQTVLVSPPPTTAIVDSAIIIIISWLLCRMSIKYPVCPTRDVSLGFPSFADSTAKILYSANADTGKYTVTAAGLDIALFVSASNA